MRNRIRNRTWILLGHGSYNNAYVNESRTEIFKVQRDADPNSAPTDLPERSVDLWNAINPHLPRAYILKDRKLGKGWVSVFVKGDDSTDDEMPAALIDIFRRTGRIIVDACGRGNFKTTDEGLVVPVDIGMALQLEYRENAYFEKPTRRKSIVSLETWADLQKAYKPYFEIYSDPDNPDKRPVTVETIKALLFIKSCRPDIYDADFLLTDKECRKLLAQAYDSSLGIPKPTENLEKPEEPDEILPPETVIMRAKEILLKKREVNLDATKESCINELERYIASRGAMQKGVFVPSRTTQFFRGNDVRYKVKGADALIHLIRDADSLEEVGNIIDEAREDPGMMKQRGRIFAATMRTCLGRCKLTVEVAKEENLKSGLLQQAGRRTFD